MQALLRLANVTTIQYFDKEAGAIGSRENKGEFSLVDLVNFFNQIGRIAKQ